MRLAALALLAASACATHVSLRAKWAPAQTYSYDPAQYPDDAAVVLYAADEVLLPSVLGGWYTQLLHHRVYAIQHESALGLAELRIPIAGNEKLVALYVRHRSADGKTRTLRPSEVFVDESGDESQRTENARVFRIPAVQVGSVLEYVYVLEVPYLTASASATPLGPYPVRRYDINVEFAEELSVDAALLNSAQTFKPAPSSLGWPLFDPPYSRLTASVRDIPARWPEEAFAANWTFSQPWWAVRLLRVRLPMVSYPGAESWRDALTPWTKGVWKGGPESTLGRFDDRLDMRGCASVMCRIERARTWVLAQTRYAGPGEWDSVRKGADVLRSGRATAFERALLLQRVLAIAGVSVQLAAYTAPATRKAELSWPDLRQLNRLLVQVPAQGELDAPVWLDPGCDACQPGTVSEAAAGSPAIVFSLNFAGSLIAGPGTIDAPSLGVSQRVDVKTVQLDAAGNAFIEERDERTAQWGLERCATLSDRGRRERREEALEELRRLSPTARLERLDEPQCLDARSRAVETGRLVLPAHALVTAARLQVPLSLLAPLFSQSFIDETRTNPIAFTEGRTRVEQRVDLDLDGWKLEAPVQEQRTAPGLTATFEARPTERGATVTVTVATVSGVHPASEFPQYRAVADFLRGTRSRLLVFTR